LDCRSHIISTVSSDKFVLKQLTACLPQRRKVSPAARLHFRHQSLPFLASSSFIHFHSVSYSSLFEMHLLSLKRLLSSLESQAKLIATIRHDTKCLSRETVSLGLLGTALKQKQLDAGQSPTLARLAVPLATGVPRRQKLVSQLAMATSLGGSKNQFQTDYP